MQLYFCYSLHLEDFRLDKEMNGEQEEEGGNTRQEEERRAGGRRGGNNVVFPAGFICRTRGETPGASTTFTGADDH